MASAGSGGALALPEILDLRAAAPLRAAIAERRGDDLMLDAANVQRLGGQCLQVLLAAQSAWRAEGRGFAVSTPSPAFEEALQTMGAPVFDPPAAVGGLA